jgi:DNA-binding NtrC family response regulator
VCECASCEEAILQLCTEADELDLLVLDIQFPVDQMQGVEAVTLIRRRRPELAVIVLSVHHDVGLALHFGALGVRDYLAKVGDLKRTLPRAVERALAAAAPPAPAVPLPPLRVFAEVRKASYLRAFHLCGGNMSEAARRLGVPYGPYREALIEWGVVRPRTRGP